MIISFTQDLAALFKIKLNIAHSKKFMGSPPLDDWVMGLLFSEKSSTGVFMIHRHSLLTLFVVSTTPNLTNCLNLLYEQLLTIIQNSGFIDKKYCRYYHQLFYQIISVKHDNRLISGEIGYFKQHLRSFEEKAIINNKIIHSIEFVNFFNNLPKKQFDFKTSLEVFIELFKIHYEDPILMTVQDKIV